MPDLKELDRARERWRYIRRRMGQSTDPSLQPSGLAHRVKSPSARLLILPRDPFATQLSFDDEFWGWWTNHAPAPFETQVHWTNTEPTIDAAVKFRGSSDQWTTYLGLCRHGGVEAGWKPTWSGSHGRRYLGLGQTVGRVWIGTSTQAEAASRFAIAGPWELTLVLYETEGVYLAGFGTGWAEPHLDPVYDLRAQQAARIVIRREFDTFPESEKDLRALAFDVGARIEDAWGIKYRRFIDRVGDMAGEFNPRLWNF